MGKKLTAVCLAVLIALLTVPTAAFGAQAAESSLVQTVQEIEPLIDLVRRDRRRQQPCCAKPCCRPDPDAKWSFRSFTEFFKGCWQSFLSLFQGPKDEQKRIRRPPTRWTASARCSIPATRTRRA